MIPGIMKEKNQRNSLDNAKRDSIMPMLSTRDRDLFIRMLNSDAEPNDALKKAINVKVSQMKGNQMIQKVCYVMGMLTIPASIYIYSSGNINLGIFVGLWAPTFFLLSSVKPPFTDRHF